MWGACIKLDKESEDILTAQGMDFSVMKSSRRKNTNYLFLSPAAFINHSCTPNCEYMFNEKHEVIVRAIKKIYRGGELFAYYPQDYFGPRNQSCECTECKNRK